MAFGWDDLIAPAASLIGGLFANESNRDIANQANQFSAQQYATRYQTTVQDLTKAGLSPMLAYGQGAGSAPSGAVGAPQQNVASSAAEAYMQSQQRKLLEEQVNNMRKDGVIKDEQAKTQEEITKKERENAWLATAQRAQIEQSVEKESAGKPYWSSNANLANLKSEREVKLLFEQIENVVQQTLTGKASASQLNETVEKLKAETSNLNLDAKEKKAFADFWDHVGEGGAAAKEMLPFLKALRILIGK